MKFGLVFVVILWIGVKAKETPSLHASFENYVDVMNTINNSPFLTKEWRKHVNLVREDPLVERFGWCGERLSSMSCPGYVAKSSAVPSSVHKLRVGDIKVIAAMGDSLTAANGASAWTVLGCLTNYRGKAWSIGGDGSYENGLTLLPNIMRQFNPDLIGYSTGNGDRDASGAGFNVAVAGDVAQDMPGQAIELVNRLRADSRVDFEKDWKMVTLFIGGNNLCAFCDDRTRHSAATYIGEIEAALDYLAANLPRAYVNVVEIFDITPVADLGSGFICGLVHSAVCGCGHNVGQDRKDELSDLSRQYQTVTQELVDSGKYDIYEDFVVINQPFLRQTVPPPSSDGSPDLSYFAPDCFHFSEKGHNKAGKALWNNLVTPLARKSVDWGLDAPAICPQSTYLPTKRN